MTEETTSNEPVQEIKLEQAKMNANELTEKLSTLNDKKENAFQKKNDISQKIGEKIKQVNDYKKLRNDLTKQVRDMKVERDKLNTEISTKIAELKIIQPKEKIEMPLGQKGERLNPRELRKQMKALETKIETIPMSFDAEQKTMKIIKGFKKQLDQCEVIEAQHGNVMQKSKEIDKLKRTANALHAKVTYIATQSQDYHEKLLLLSKEIEDLKAEEEAMQQQFMTAKQEYMAIAGNVKEAQHEMQAARAVVREQKAQEKRKKDAEDQKTLKQRAKEVEEKMMRGEKLTTEDLLAMQSIKE